MYASHLIGRCMASIMMVFTVAAIETGHTAHATNTAEPTTVKKASATTTINSNHDTPTPTETIVGGIVAAVTIIGLVILGIFALRRRKTKIRDTESPVNRPAMDFTPQSIYPTKHNKTVPSHHMQPVSPISPLGPDGRQFAFGPNSISTGLCGQMSFSPPPIYETPQCKVRVHEIADSSVFGRN
ncbi:hypothetical protein FLAG1_07344 [Fusarium langsethiae]|uniref:Uncharacterized protein n=1 Tax=Fusarium langsethiae TaxID=179993 RepID=A0A0M9EU89_FUSLA|nr:hypothetical protein FLAG1_07344 [Fusarium langsethiae]GKU05085.1 unnamed protein product [Fusarium langsethiae]